MRTTLLALMLLSVSSVSLAQAAPPERTPPTPEMQAQMDADRAAYDALANGPGTGPYPAVMAVEPTLPDHVVYRPADLSKMDDTKLGIVVWGNGGCREDGASARQHLTEIASHGYLVIAPGRILSGPSATGTLPENTRGADGKFPPMATTANDLREGIDWALAENTRDGSALFGTIDPALIAVAGHSCGGLQALQVAGDPRVKTVMIHNSGVFNDGASSISGLTVDKSLLDTLHTPVIYFLGGPGDVAHPNGSDDVARIGHVPVVLADLPVGHGGTFWAPNGGSVAATSVDWLEWQLRDDRTAARTFMGDNCRLCVSGEWTLTRKNFD